MNYVVLVKQVPDITQITEEHWDKETGALKRAMLDLVPNPLDLDALACAYYMQKLDPHNSNSKTVMLTMGLPKAEEVLLYCLERHGDEGIVLTDKKLGGADTIATSYSLAQAIRKIESEIFQNNNYIILAGMQSQDGDTAQVPPQIAEELGIDHIAYVSPDSIKYVNNKLTMKRIGPTGVETITPKQYPVMVTTIKTDYKLFRSFQRARAVFHKKFPIHVWDAAAINTDEKRIGLTGSKTQVYKVNPAAEMQAKRCIYPKSIEELVNLMLERYNKGSSETISLKHSYSLNEKQPTYKGQVWVYIETESGNVKPVSLELLSKARELTEPLSEKVGAVLIGDNVSHLADTLIAHGANIVYVAEHPLLKHFHPIPYKKTITDLVIKHTPQILLFGATPLGRELAPRVAYSTQSGLTADCTGLEIDDYDKKDLVAILKQTRPALGGNIMATIMTKDANTQMATVRPGVFKSQEPDATRQGEIIRMYPTILELDIKTEVLSIESCTGGSALEHADIIVSGGAGLDSAENFHQYLNPLKTELVNLLGGIGEVGASRTAVEHGFSDRAHQVGQTGQTVKPKLYIAVAISGAVQHISGMQNSETIIVINKDPTARIFKHADLGIITDYRDVVTKITEELRKRNQKLT